MRYHDKVVGRQDGILETVVDDSEFTNKFIESHDDPIVAIG